ncbi:MAG: bifunctional demethylmenaquinone methyltransferase/2-methoxy-6-polyprenyl-1,4-benzoquinol methylase UbiE [Bacteroidales bacterium]|nr:bifunctional demethylmenaquinone methyltransferase/2-methoxy-6-polyprenyl-1,4-benzoquinol methylase UbiE [Bacteroidales bacterium]
MSDKEKEQSEDLLTGAELIHPYDDSRAKSEQVEEMFDSIAPAYDFMNLAMTFGLHRLWQRHALNVATKQMSAHVGYDILDIATGTGDIAFELYRRFPRSRIKGVDLSEGMLRIAEKKLKKLDQNGQKSITFEQGDSLDLRYDDNSFDLITVAYGVRNFEHLSRGLAEMARVLRPGGKLCIIELSRPRRGLTLWLYQFYTRCIIPLIGRVVSGDSRAYTYLPESIAAAPQREAMTAIMSEAGLSDCKWKSLTFGAVTYYIAGKDSAASSSTEGERKNTTPQ